MTLTTLATETYVTLCPESYTAPIFTYLFKLYCTLKSTEKNMRTWMWRIHIYEHKYTTLELAADKF
jgi:hypothetical protein